MNGVRSELLKIRSTRTTAALALGMLALVLLLVLLAGLASELTALDSADEQRNLFSIGGVSTLFAALAGVLVVTSEFRYGTIRSTLIVSPRRPRVLAAKLAAGIVAGCVFGAAGEGLAIGIGSLVLHSRGMWFALDNRDLLQIGLGTVAGSALWAAIGVGVGACVRNQIAAIVGLFAWGFVVENLLFGLVPSVGRFTPGEASTALAGGTAEHLLSAGGGGVVLVAWAAALSALGGLLLVVRDVG